MRQPRKKRNRLYISSMKVKEYDIGKPKYNSYSAVSRGSVFSVLGAGAAGSVFGSVFGPPGAVIGIIAGLTAGGLSGISDYQKTIKKKVEIKRFLNRDDAVNNVAVVLKRRNPLLSDKQAIDESKRRIAIVRAHIKHHESMEKGYVPNKV